MNLQHIVHQLLFTNVDNTLLLFLGAVSFLLTLFLVVFFSLSLKRLTRRYQNAYNIPKAEAKLGFFMRKFRKVQKLFKMHKSGFVETFCQDINNSFKAAYEKLKIYFEKDNNFIYNIPWFLMIGANKSGKSTVLNNLQLSTLVEPDMNDAQKTCKWWFFNKGIVIEPNGQLIETSNHSSRSIWHYFINTIGKFRSRRPLDGVIITISALDLLQNPDKAISDAKEIFVKLSQCQKTLGMKFPVYTLVTKCDVMKGFADIAQQLPKDKKDNVFGWSNPYDPDIIYSPKWLEEWQGTMDQNMRILVNEIFASAPDFERNHKIISLKLNISNLYASLSKYLDCIFANNKSADTYTLRGIYLTGNEMGNHVENLISVLSSTGESDANVSNPQSNDENQDQNNKFNSVEPDYTHKNFNCNSPFSLVFLNDLFKEKIFAEMALAKPIMRLTRYYDRQLNWIRAISFSFFMLWSIVLVLNSFTLKNYVQFVVPMMNHINHSLQGSFYLKHIDRPEELKLFLAEESQITINNLSSFRYKSLRLIGIPASWSNSVHYDVCKSIKKAYEELIIPSLNSHFIQKIEETANRKLFDLKALPQGKNKDIQNDIYHHIQTYVNDVEQIEQYVDIYNDMNQYGFVRAISKLIYFLHGLKVPKSLVQNTKDFENKFLIKFDNIDIKKYQKSFAQTLSELFKQYSSIAFSLKYQFHFITKIINNFKTLSNKREFNTISRQQFIKIVSETDEAIEHLNNNINFLGIFNAGYEPYIDYRDLFSSISNIKIFGKKQSSAIQSQILKDLSQFKSFLLSLNNQLMGNIFEERKDLEDNNKIRLQLTDEVIKINDVIRKLMTFDFIDTQHLQPLAIPVLLETQTLNFRESFLNDSIELADDFKKFIKIIEAVKISKLYESFQNMAAKSLKVYLRHNIIKSFNISHNKKPKLAHLQETVSEFVINSDKLMRVKSELQQYINEDFFDSYFAILDKQGFNILKTLDNEFENSNLYVFDFIKLSNWSGEQPAAVTVFNTSDKVSIKETLKSYYGKLEKFLNISQGVLEYFGKKEEHSSDDYILQKWMAIYQDVKNYKRAEGSSLRELEKFLLKTLIAYNKNNFAPLTFQHDKVNFFAQQLNRLKESLDIACRKIAKKYLIVKYNKLSSFFNSKIAGKYPFSRNLLDDKNQASLNDLSKLYSLLNMFDKNDLIFIKKEAAGNDKIKPIYTFIQALQKIKPILPHQIIDKSKLSENKPVEFEVDFKTEHSDSQGLENIIDQIIITKRFRLSWFNLKKNPKCTVFPNDKLLLVIKWAKDGHIIPRPAHKLQKHKKKHRVEYIAQANQAIFDFGKYGLITMLHRYMVSMDNEGFALLRFEIPTDRLTATKSGIMREKHTDAIFFLKIKVLNSENDGFHDISQLLSGVPFYAPKLDFES